MTRATLLALVALFLTACGGPVASQPSFKVEVAPSESPLEVRVAIPGQETSFLVGIADSGSGGGAVSVSAHATLATVDHIVPSRIEAGQVAEVWLTIDPSLTTDATASVKITVSRGVVTRSLERSILIRPMSSEGRERDAQPHFAYWTGWLAAHHSELGITASTSWRPLFVSTLLVVSHMSYYSDGWEMGLAWHAATIPPNDWSQIYLRRRGTDMRPSISFKADSFSGRTTPYAVAPPDVVVR